MKKLIMISHFWNEEFLLPYWIKHHKDMFDHVVMIDYDSTDSSVDIIRSMAPEWEIRKSKNRDFDAIAVDQEVMAIEREFDGWKVALNTTEFIVNWNLRQFLDHYEKMHPNHSGVQMSGVVMIDRLEDREHELTDEPLVLQKQYGFLEEKHRYKFYANGNMSRTRIIHKMPDGAYHVGRHSTRLPDVKHHPNLFLAWFQWCPMKYIVDRKLAIQNRIPKDTRFGQHHFITKDQLENRYLQYTNEAENLWSAIPMYKTHLEFMFGSEQVKKKCES